MLDDLTTTRNYLQVHLTETRNISNPEKDNTEAVRKINIDIVPPEGNSILANSPPSEAVRAEHEHRIKCACVRTVASPLQEFTSPTNTQNKTQSFRLNGDTITLQKQRRSLRTAKETQDNTSTYDEDNDTNEKHEKKFHNCAHLERRRSLSTTMNHTSPTRPNHTMSKKKATVQSGASLITISSCRKCNTLPGQ